jgi:hypothetical protein
MASCEPITYFNGSPKIEDWYFNDTQLMRAFFNDVLIFERTLYIDLPCNPGYDSLNLSSFIASNNPDGLRTIFVKLRSGCHHPTIKIFNDINNLCLVTLIIDGYLEANENDPALVVGSNNVKLINHGEIRGRGGDGGAGGRGADGRELSETTTTSKSGTWHVYCTPCTGRTAIISISNGGPTSDCISNCNTTSYGGWKRGSYISGSYNHCGEVDIYYNASTTTTTTVNKAGGVGGAGGIGPREGQWYNHPFEDRSPGGAGTSGGHPPETQAGDGGYGGKGGDWGEDGEDGEDGHPNYYGDPGDPGVEGTEKGIAIQGSGNLISGSSLGTVKGKIL